MFNNYFKILCGPDIKKKNSLKSAPQIAEAIPTAGVNGPNDMHKLAIVPIHVYKSSGMVSCILLVALPWFAVCHISIHFTTWLRVAPWPPQIGLRRVIQGVHACPLLVAIMYWVWSKPEHDLELEEMTHDDTSYQIYQLSGKKGPLSHIFDYLAKKSL